MDDWNSDQYDQMLRGGNDKWDGTWKQGNATAHFREKQAWKAVRDGVKERAELREVVKNKYESEVATHYREMIARKDGDVVTELPILHKLLKRFHLQMNGHLHCENVKQLHFHLFLLS
jgi:hypothetical protein